MPRRDIGLLDYQPVVFRLVEPNSDSIADNFTDEEITLYDKILGKCRVFGSQWCQLANLNDPVNMQWKASEVGENRWLRQVFRSANVTGVAANKLIDSGAFFLGTPGAAPLNFLVLNTATGQSAWITARDSATELSLNANIFTSAGEPYVIYSTQASTHGWSIDYSSGVLYIVQYAGGGPTTLEVANPTLFSPMLRLNRWNRVTFRVPQYNYGAFEIIVNGPSGPLATYTVASAGEFEFYVWGEPGSITTFTINVATDFSGTIDLFSLEIFECNHSYTISALDLDGNFIGGQTITYGDSADDLAMLTGNVVYNGTWADFTDQCGCVRLALTDNGNTPPCQGELIPNPEMDNGEIWNTGEKVCDGECCGLPLGGEFGDEMYTFFNENCVPLRKGVEYCLTIEVCAVTVGIGNFAEVELGRNLGNPQFIGIIPGNASSGTYQFTFTPNDDDYISLHIQHIFDYGITGIISHVSLQECQQEPIYYALSECFKLCAPDCSTTISYRNPVNAYGINYEHDPDFRLFTRNQARIINQSIRDNALSVFKTGSGVGSNPYHDGLRVADFNVGPAPAYYHMVLATALAHSDCKVDGVLVQRISEYTPDFSDAFELSRATTEVQFKNQRNLRKTL